MKKFTCKLKNKDMNKETYSLRREVIGIIYELKKLVDIPRIDVRITDDHEQTLAMGLLGQNVVWISERAIKQENFDLFTIVCHELVHAITGFRHDEKCPLMCSVHKPLKKEQATKLFLKYVLTK